LRANPFVLSSTENQKRKFYFSLLPQVCGPIRLFFPVLKIKKRKFYFSLLPQVCGPIRWFFPVLKIKKAKILIFTFTAGLRANPSHPGEPSRQSRRLRINHQPTTRLYTRYISYLSKNAQISDLLYGRNKFNNPAGKPTVSLQTVLRIRG